MGSRFMKIISLLIYVFGLISSYIIAAVYGVVTKFDVTSGTYTERNVPLTIGIFLLSYIGTFILGIIVSSIGTILENQEELLEKIESKAETSTAHQEGFSNSRADLLGESKPDGWRCPTCGTENPSGALSCKGCGKYK